MFLDYFGGQFEAESVNVRGFPAAMTVVTSDGKRIVLDDHDFKNMHLIIGAIAHGFMPDIWTAEGKRVGEQTPNQEPVDSANQNASDSKSVS